MKEGGRMMTKNSFFTVMIAVSICAAPGQSFGWGAATHTYLAKELGHEPGVLNLNEMYGAVAPDMFNIMFGYEHRGFLWNKTHYGFMKVVDRGNLDESRAFGYGFASHNESWGADHTAHISSAGIDSAEGYVPTKKKILAPQLKLGMRLFLTSKGIAYTPELLDELSLAIADTAVESAVDLLISRNEDPKIGTRLLVAAKLRSPFVPMLLSSAYAKDLAGEADIVVEQAILLIVEAEVQFREYIELYGGILAGEDAVDLMAEQGAGFAERMLQQQYGIVVEVPTELMKTGLLAAVEVVQDDYSEELRATLDFVSDQLESHSVQTALTPY
jgi:hypothetical protein